MTFHDIISVIRDFDEIKVIDTFTRHEYYFGRKSQFPMMLFDKIWKYEVDNIHPLNNESHKCIVVEVYE